MRLSNVFILLPALTACGQEINLTLSQEASTEAAPLYIQDHNVWNTQWAGNPVAGQVRVCWAGAYDPAAMTWVEDSVRRTWDVAAGWHFYGWDQCPANGYSSHYVRIIVEDTAGAPHTESLGTTGSASTPTTVHLNFTFQNWGSGYCGVTGGDTIQHCIMYIAAHEFGHVLGFSHEQNRADTPASCTTAAQGPNGDVTYGTWDQNSIMDYCNPTWNNAGLLSVTDILGLQKYYSPIGVRFTANETTHQGFFPSTTQYAMSDVNADGYTDLVMVMYGNTGSGKVEIHALSGAPDGSGHRYQNYIVHTAVAALVAPVDPNQYTFSVIDVDNDKKGDLVFTLGNSGGFTEVHALAASSNWQNYNLHTRMQMSATFGPRYVHFMAQLDSNPNNPPYLVIVDKAATSTQQAVYIFRGGSANYQTAQVNGVLSASNLSPCNWTTFAQNHARAAHPTGFDNVLACWHVAPFQPAGYQVSGVQELEVFDSYNPATRLFVQPLETAPRGDPALQYAFLVNDQSTLSMAFINNDPNSNSLGSTSVDLYNSRDIY